MNITLNFISYENISQRTKPYHQNVNVCVCVFILFLVCLPVDSSLSSEFYFFFDLGKCVSL